VIVVGCLILAVKSKRRRSARLRSRFGPEYDHAVAQYGSVARAEKALEDREKRSQQIVIRPLSPETRERYSEAWRTVQAEFVDAPAQAVTEADQLLEKLMSERGYPTGDFEQQASDLSVGHPRVVGNYRQAHLVADKQRHGQASTEDLRRALVQYRLLYEELLGVQFITSQEVKR